MYEKLTERIAELSEQIGHLMGLLDALRMLVDAEDLDNAMSAYKYRKDFDPKPSGRIDTKTLRELFGWAMTDEANAYYTMAKESFTEEPEEETPIEEAERLGLHNEPEDELPFPEEPFMEFPEEEPKDPYGIKAAAEKILEAADDEPKKGRGIKIDREEVLEYARQGMSAKWISEQMGRGLSSVNRVIKELKDEGRLD